MSDLTAAFRPDLGDCCLGVAVTAPGRGVTALFGRSGCGKTTLLRCLAGLERAASDRPRRPWGMLAAARRPARSIKSRRTGVLDGPATPPRWAVALASDRGCVLAKRREKAVLRVRAWGPWWALILAPTLLLGIDLAMAADDCLARVFDRYCLAGDLAALRNQGPAPVIEQTEGEHRALVYQEGPERIYVLGYRNAIYKVVRRYRGATQLRFEELYQALRARYGAGEDRSEFPVYADTPGRRQTAIRRGEGRAVHAWRPADNWHVELSWTREMGLAVAYLATALDAEQRAASGAGL